MHESESKSWLQRLKDESWEAELLVSAVAIYGIFQSFSLIDFLINFLINKLDEAQYPVGYFIAFLGLLALSVLATMFIIHFVLRSYWIGLVGLNSVFPDYSLKDSAYSEIYTKKMTDYLPKLTKTIDVIDELCSVIFSAAFTILGTYTYIAIISTIYLLVYNTLKDIVPHQILMLPLYFVALLFLAQIILNIIGNIKRFKTNTRIQHLFFVVVKFSSFLLYGPLSKNLLQVAMIFGSNFKKKKGLVILVLVFFMTGAGLSGFQAEKTNLFHLLTQYKKNDSTQSHPYFYAQNNVKSSFLFAPEINGDIIQQEVVQLFIPIFDNELETFRNRCGFEKPKNVFTSDKTAIEKIRALYLTCYQKYHTVRIDDTTMNVNFVKYDHPVTGQFGILCFIDLSAFEKGTRTLEVVKELGTKKQWDIPFYYLKTN
ncbi:MAG: hypothetical protein AAF717_08755 [Bacteroidota bacterium]